MCTFTKLGWTSVVVTNRIKVLSNDKFLFDITVPAFSVDLGGNVKPIHYKNWSLKCLCCERNLVKFIIPKRNELAFSLFCAWITNLFLCYVPAETYFWVDVWHFCNSIKGKLCKLIHIWSAYWGNKGDVSCWLWSKWMI